MYDGNQQIICLWTKNYVYLHSKYIYGERRSWKLNIKRGGQDIAHNGKLLAARTWIEAALFPDDLSLFMALTGRVYDNIVPFRESNISEEMEISP